MESRKAVLSTPRTLDMVPLGDDLQGGSNQGGKALSDIQVPSLRFRQLATQGSNHLVKEGARNKHFQDSIHYFRDMNARNYVVPTFVRTDVQHADGFTKPLARPQFLPWAERFVRP